MVIAERTWPLQAVKTVGLAAGVSSAEERAVIVWIGDGIEAVVKSALMRGAKRAASLVALVGALLDAAAMIETVPAVVVQLAATASRLGALELQMSIAESLEAAIGANVAVALARRDAALRVLVTAVASDGLERAVPGVAGVSDAEVAAGVPVRGRIALESGTLLVLLATLVEEVVRAVLAPVLVATVCGLVSRDRSQDEHAGDVRRWQYHGLVSSSG